MAPVILLAMTVGSFQTEAPAGAFSQGDSDRLVAFWNSEGRLTSTDVNQEAPYQVVMSAAGSAWLHQMYKKRDPGQAILPTELPKARNPRHRDWDAAIDQQYDRDKAWAVSVAAWINNGLSEAGSPGPVDRPVVALPPDLIALAEAPPPFFVVIRKQRYSVSFDGFVASYEEGVDVPRKYPYFRSPLGVVSASSAPASYELSDLCRRAGLPDVLARPLQAVAKMEGGFDTINTYDTGGVSLGLIQFASLMDGRGSLASLLGDYKNRHPLEFESNFRKYGVDVDYSGRLTVIDPRTGFENSGSDAVRVIVADKRLTAVFQRAGRLSSAFRTGQIRVLGQRFNPLGLSIPVTLGGSTVSVPVRSFVRSEAGVATLMDRLVNRGSIEPLPSVVSSLAAEYGVTTVSGLVGLERLIVERMSYRHNFLASSLGQPPAVSLVAKNPEFGNRVTPTIEGNLTRGSTRPAPAGGLVDSGGNESVAPFDPVKGGRVSSNQPKKPEEPVSKPAVAKEPTPTQPVGPITVAGG
jgi:hypothetical protein